MRRAASSAMPPASKRAQIGDRGGEREGKLLRLGAAGIVHDAAVGGGERALEAALRKIGGDRRDARRDARARAPDSAPCSANAPSGSRPKRMSTAAGDSPCRSTSAASVSGSSVDMRAEFERDRDAGIEMDAGERAFDRVRARCKAVAMRADRAGRDQHQPVGAVVELVQRFGVAGVRVGMVDALHDLPARAGRASGNRRRVGARADRAARWSGRRRSGSAGVSKLAPLSTPSTSLRHCAWVAGGKFGGQRQMVGRVGHGGKWHADGRGAND